MFSKEIGLENTISFSSCQECRAHLLDVCCCHPQRDSQNRGLESGWKPLTSRMGFVSVQGPNRKQQARIKYQTTSIKQHASSNWALDSGKKSSYLVFSNSIPPTTYHLLPATPLLPLPNMISYRMGPVTT